MTDKYIQKLKSGDTDALGFIINEHKDYVYSIAYKIVRNNEIAEEITQDVFVKVYRNINSFRKESRFTTWLYSIAYRTSLNYTDRKKIVYSRSDLRDDGGTEGYYESVESDGLKMDALPEQSELQQILWRAIDKIPVLQGVVILLYYMNQFTVTEIAEILNSPVSTIKTHLHRGRNALKNFLQKEYSLEELL